MEWHGAPIKWPYKWVAGFTTAMSGVLGNPIPIFATGPLCSRSVFLKLIGLKTNRAMRQKYSSKVSFFAYPLRINKVTSQFFNGKWWFPTMKVMAKHHYCQVFPARQGSNAINVKVLGIFASLLAEYSQSSPGGFNTLFGGVGVRGWVGHQWTLTVFIKRWLFGNTSSIVACSPPHFPPPPTTMSVEQWFVLALGRAVSCNLWRNFASEKTVFFHKSDSRSKGSCKNINTPHGFLAQSMVCVLYQIVF